MVFALVAVLTTETKYQGLKGRGSLLVYGVRRWFIIASKHGSLKLKTAGCTAPALRRKASDERWC